MRVEPGKVTTDIFLKFTSLSEDESITLSVPFKSRPTAFTAYPGDGRRFLDACYYPVKKKLDLSNNVLRELPSKNIAGSYALVSLGLIGGSYLTSVYYGARSGIPLTEIQAMGLTRRPTSAPESYSVRFLEAFECQSLIAGQQLPSSFAGCAVALIKLGKIDSGSLGLHLTIEQAVAGEQTRVGVFPNEMMAAWWDEIYHNTVYAVCPDRYRLQVETQYELFESDLLYGLHPVTAGAFRPVVDRNYAAPAFTFRYYGRSDGAGEYVTLLPGSAPPSLCVYAEWMSNLSHTYWLALMSFLVGWSIGDKMDHSPSLEESRPCGIPTRSRFIVYPDRLPGIAVIF